MKTLSEIKDEIAKSHGYKSFYEMQFPYDMVCEEDINLIAKHYAEEALKEAAKRAKINKTGNSGSYLDASVNRQSILNLIEELK